MELFQEVQESLEIHRSIAENQQASLVQEREQIEIEKASSLDERQAALNTVKTEDLAIYVRLRKNKTGVAVAKVEERACIACGSTLTAALHQAARSPSQVVFCESCGRILYAT